MKYYELDKDEAEILNDFSKEKFVSVKSARLLLNQYRKYAEESLKKSKNINIRVPEKDLLKIKSIAAEKGIPYQTLLASVIHQYSAGNDHLFSQRNNVL